MKTFKETLITKIAELELFENEIIEGIVVLKETLSDDGLEVTLMRRELNQALITKSNLEIALITYSVTSNRLEILEDRLNNTSDYYTKQSLRKAINAYTVQLKAIKGGI